MKIRSKFGALIGAGLLTFAVAGVALASTSDWGGNGFPSDTCARDGSPATMLWIWTGGTPTSLTINGVVQSGSWVQEGNGSWHFTVTVDGSNYPPTSASVDYSGDSGVLTLSHCEGAAPSGTGAGSTDTPAPSGTGAGSTDTPAPSGTGAGSTDTPAPSGTGAGDTNQPTQPPTDTLGSNGSGPSDGAWLLVVGLGVLLASVVVLTPARAKSRR